MKVQLVRKERLRTLHADGTLGGDDAFLDVPAGTVLNATVHLGQYLVTAGPLAARVWASWIRTADKNGQHWR